jgi:hypothetical protein
MSSLYSQFKTDKNIEQEGVILEYGKTDDGKIIAIRIARAGGGNLRYTKLLEAAIKPYRRQLQNETMDNNIAETITQRVYAQSVVLGWENVEDAEGKPMEFNVENCIKLFKDLPDLWSDIQSQANRAALFRQDILDEDAKN